MQYFSMVGCKVVVISSVEVMMKLLIRMILWCCVVLSMVFVMKVILKLFRVVSCFSGVIVCVCRCSVCVIVLVLWVMFWVLRLVLVLMYFCIGMFVKVVINVVVVVVLLIFILLKFSILVCNDLVNWNLVCSVVWYCCVVIVGFWQKLVVLGVILWFSRLLWGLKL